MDTRIDWHRGNLGIPRLPGGPHRREPFGVALGQIGSLACVLPDVEEVLVLLDLEVLPVPFTVGTLRGSVSLLTEHNNQARERALRVRS